MSRLAQSGHWASRARCPFLGELRPRAVGMRVPIFSASISGSFSRRPVRILPARHQVQLQASRASSGSFSTKSLWSLKCSESSRAIGRRITIGANARHGSTPCRNSSPKSRLVIHFMTPAVDTIAMDAIALSASCGVSIISKERCGSIAQNAYRFQQNIRGTADADWLRPGRPGRAWSEYRVAAGDRRQRRCFAD